MHRTSAGEKGVVRKMNSVTNPLTFRQPSSCTTSGEAERGAAAGPSGLTADILRFGLQSATVFGPAACCWASWGVRLPVLRQQLPQFTVQILASHSAQPPVQAALEAAGALQAPGWNPPSWQGFVTRPYS